MEPNKPVVFTRNNIGTAWMLEHVLERMGFECTHVINWFDDEFADDAFEVVSQSVTSTVPKSVCLFEVEKEISECEMETICKSLATALQDIRYGAYSLRGATFARFLKVDTSEIFSNIIVEEYEDFCQFKKSLHIKNQGVNSQELIEKELSNYFKTHKVFNGFIVSKGQQFMKLSLITEDMEKVKEIIENLNLPISTKNMVWGNVGPDGTVDIKVAPIETNENGVQNDDFQLLCMKKCYEITQF